MFIGYYAEYGATNSKSMKEYFENQPYEGKDKIIEYLRNNGTAIMARTALAKDRITGDSITNESGVVLYSDGKYDWYSDLAYHVEKYNLRLPKEFEEYVLNRP